MSLIDPLTALEAELQKLEAIIGGVLTAFHTLKPKVEQAAQDAQQLQTDAKAAVAGVPIPPTPPAAQ